MSEEEHAAAIRSSLIGEGNLTDSSVVGVSAFDGRDGKKRVDIRLFWGARHMARRKKSVSADRRAP